MADASSEVADAGSSSTNPATWPGLQQLCSLLGAKPEVLCLRFRNPWFTLGAIHGSSAVLVMLTLLIFGWGSHWDKWLTRLAAWGCVATVIQALLPCRQAPVALKRNWLFHAATVLFLAPHVMMVALAALLPPDAILLGSPLDYCAVGTVWVRSTV